MLGLGNSLVGGAPPSEFTPADLSTLIHWYKFDTGITQATVGAAANQVTAWQDQKGSNHLLKSDFDSSGTVDADEVPEYSSGAIKFTNATENLTFTSQLALGAFSIYGRVKSSNFSDVLFEKANDAEFVKFQTTTEFRIQPGGSRQDLAISGDASLANNTKFTFGFERNGDGNIFAHANGEYSETDSEVAISNTLVLDRMGAPLVTMWVYEIVICNAAITAGQRTKLNAYLDAI